MRPFVMASSGDDDVLAHLAIEGIGISRLEIGRKVIGAGAVMSASRLLDTEHVDAAADAVRIAKDTDGIQE